MGKAKIVSHILDSEYNIIYYNDMTVIDLKVIKINDAIAQCNIDILSAESEISTKQTEVSELADLFDVLITAYNNCATENIENLEICDPQKETLNTKNIECLVARSELGALEQKLNDLKIRLERLKKESLLYGGLTGEEEITAWCIDLCDRPAGEPDTGVWKNHGEIIPADTEVGTIEIFDFSTRKYNIYIVAASYTKDPTYDPLIHGIRGSTLASSGEEFVYNYNMRGPQAAWQPDYRLAIVDSIDAGIAQITYNAIKDLDGVKFNTMDDEADSDIPSDYMLCSESPPFSAGDQIIVKFGDVKMDLPEIIGYHMSPQPCLSFTYALACQRRDGNTFFEYENPGSGIVWESENNLSTFAQVSSTIYMCKSSSNLWISPSGSPPVVNLNKKGIVEFPDYLEPIINYYSMFEPYYNHLALTNKKWSGITHRDASFDDFEVGGLHSEIDGSDFVLVAYVITRVHTRLVRADRYSVIYDPNILQPDISTFADPNYNAPDYGVDYQKPLGDGFMEIAVPRYIESGETDTNYFVAESRQMTCNQAGNKTIFFLSGYPVYDIWLILELEDNGTALTVTLHSEISEDTGIVRALDEGNVGAGSGTQRAWSIDGIPVTNSCDESSSAAGSRWYYSAITAASIRSVFLGVSYDKITDEIIILTRAGNDEVYELDDSVTWNYDKANGTSHPAEFCGDDAETAQTSKHTSNTVITKNNKEKIFINGVKISPDMDYARSSNCSNEVDHINQSKETVFNYSDIGQDIIEFIIVDLACRLFVLKVNETKIVGSGSRAISGTSLRCYNLEAPRTIKEQIYVIAGNDSTLIDTNVITDDVFLFSLPCYRGELTDTTCSGDCPPPAGYDYDTTYHYTYDGLIPDDP